MKDHILSTINWLTIDATIDSKGNYNIPDNDKKRLSEYLNLNDYNTAQELNIIKFYLLQILTEESVAKVIITNLIDNRIKEVLYNETTN